MMKPTKESKKQPVWPDPCSVGEDETFCGGKIIRTNHYVKDKVLIDGREYEDPKRRYRKWQCRKCGSFILEPRFKGEIDPENRQPLIGQYTQEAGRDPFGWAPPEIKAMFKEALRKKTS